MRRFRRRGDLVQLRQLIPAVIWLAGVAGFLIPLQMARTSPHAGLLRVAALGWLVAFGVINAAFVVRAFRDSLLSSRSGDSPFRR